MAKKTYLTAALFFLVITYTGLNALNTGDPLRHIGAYLKEAKNVSYSTDMGNEPGRVNNIRLRFSEGIIGYFSRYKTGLKIRNTDIEARDLRLKYNSPGDVDMQSSSAGSVRIHSLEISQEDLTVFAARVYRKINNVRVIIVNNRIILSGRYSGMRFEAGVMLYKPKNGAADIGLKFDGMKAGKIRVPNRLTAVLMRGDGMLLKKLGITTKLYYNNITAQNGTLRIN